MSAATVEQLGKKSSPGSITSRSRSRRIYPSVTISPLAKRFLSTWKGLLGERRLRHDREVVRDGKVSPTENRVTRLRISILVAPGLSSRLLAARGLIKHFRLQQPETGAIQAWLCRRPLVKGSAHGIRLSPVKSNVQSSDNSTVGIKSVERNIPSRAAPRS